MRANEDVLSALARSSPPMNAETLVRETRLQAPRSLALKSGPPSSLDSALEAAPKHRREDPSLLLRQLLQDLFLRLVGDNGTRGPAL
mmetsp:Transcript_8785/g.24395  ORF Transcript_8785/g.24395 Transcript_8785/m.24395 type:complete len:87 (+) Transcript_8785:73-333(+)